MFFYFDYGDNWYFEVELVAREKAEAGIKYPILLESKGEAPLQYPPCEEEDF